MKQLAVISDIHGNLPALEAVMKDIERRGISTVVCLGDLVGKGPQPAEVIDLVLSWCEGTVIGNWELGLNRKQERQSGVWQQEQIGPERLKRLAELPFCFQLVLSGRRIRLFHASAKSVFHRVLRKAPNEQKIELFENTDMTGDFPGGGTPNVIGYGDIHTAYSQVMKGPEGRGLTLFNTGSVGAPYDGIAQASYAIIEGELSWEEQAPFSITHVRVPYDIERVIRVAEQVNLPDLDRFRHEMRTGVQFK